MDIRRTLHRLWTDAGRWHAAFAAWLGQRPRTAATLLLLSAGLGLWKLAELAGRLA
jgi:hypothetical protein